MFLCDKICKKNKIVLLVLSIPLSVFLNGQLSSLSKNLNSPLFLDSIFTIFEAAMFGYLPGILVGILTNLYLEYLQDFPGYLLPFAVVNVFSAIITAFMVKRGSLKSISGALWLLILLTLGNALLGAYIVTIVFGGTTGEGVDDIVRAIIITGQSLFSSAFLGRLFINFVDKGIGILIIFPLYQFIMTREEKNTKIENYGIKN